MIESINLKNSIVTPNLSKNISKTSRNTEFSKVLNETSNPIKETTTTLEHIFQRASNQYGVPLNLLKAVAKAESEFQVNAVSRCGAQGIMQLMPATARSLGVKDSFDAEQNIMGGAKYLSQMLTRYNGDTKLALAAYNAGAGNVQKYGGIPPFTETQNYVKKITNYLKTDVTIPNTTVKTTNQIQLTDKIPYSIQETKQIRQIEPIEIIDEFTYDDYLKLINDWELQVTMMQFDKNLNVMQTIGTAKN